MRVGPDVTKHGKTTYMRAMPMGVCRIVCGSQDRLFPSDIRCQKGMIRDDTAIQDTDPRTIFRAEPRPSFARLNAICFPGSLTAGVTGEARGTSDH